MSLQIRVKKNGMPVVKDRIVIEFCGLKIVICRLTGTHEFSPYTAQKCEFDNIDITFASSYPGSFRLGMFLQPIKPLIVALYCAVYGLIS